MPDRMPESQESGHKSEGRHGRACDDEDRPPVRTVGDGAPERCYCGDWERADAEDKPDQQHRVGELENEPLDRPRLQISPSLPPAI